jgi:hypothetical protein
VDEAGFYSEPCFWAHCSRRKQISRLRKIRPPADDLAALEMTMMGGVESWQALRAFMRVSSRWESRSAQGIAERVLPFCI